MVSQMSLESYNSKFSFIHLSYSACGGEWGENSVDDLHAPLF